MKGESCLWLRVLGESISVQVHWKPVSAVWMLVSIALCLFSSLWKSPEPSVMFMFPPRDPEKDGLAMELISPGTRKWSKLYQVQLKLEMGRNFVLESQRGGWSLSLEISLKILIIIHDSSILLIIKEMEQIGAPEMRIQLQEKCEETNLCPQVQF